MWTAHRTLGYRITIACNGAGGRVGFEINTYRAGPLMRDVTRLKQIEAANENLE